MQWINSQLRQALSLCNPLFTLLAFGNNLTLSSVVRRVCNEMTDKSKVQYGLVNVLHNNSEWIDIHSSNSSDSANDCRIESIEYLQDVKRDLSGDKSDTDKGLNAVILVRPDGHIACASCIYCDENLELQLCAILENGLLNSLG